MDKTIELCGPTNRLTSRKQGVVVDFHPLGGSTGDRSTWYYTVKLFHGNETTVDSHQEWSGSKSRMTVVS